MKQICLVLLSVFLMIAGCKEATLSVDRGSDQRIGPFILIDESKSFELVYYSPNGENYVLCKFIIEEDMWDNPGEAFLNGSYLIGSCCTEGYRGVKERPPIVWLDNDRFLYNGIVIYDIRNHTQEKLDITIDFDYAVNLDKDKLAYSCAVKKSEDDYNLNIFIYCLKTKQTSLIYSDKDSTWEPNYQLVWDGADNLYFERYSEDKKNLIYTAKNPDYSVSLYQTNVQLYHWYDSNMYLSTMKVEMTDHLPDYWVTILNPCENRELAMFHTTDMVFGASNEVLYIDYDSGDLVYFDLLHRTELNRYELDSFVDSGNRLVSIQYWLNRFILIFKVDMSDIYRTYELRI